MAQTKIREVESGNNMNHHEDIIEELRNAWGWVGLKPLEVVDENDFGNLIVKDQDGRYWRLTPEDCTCQIIAQDRHELDALSIDQDFLHDWYMAELVAAAMEKFGTLDVGRKYCLRVPGLLGGEYGGDNLATAPLVELIRMSGTIAQQVKDLPDGAVVSIGLTD